MSKDLTESASALFLMKLAPIFIYPVGLVIVLSAAGLIIACLGHHGLALALIGVGWGWLWVASMPVFADWAISTLESQYPAQPIEEQPSADVAIVLGGAVGQPAPPRVEANLNKAFDRVIQAMRLYHAKRIKRVLIAGGAMFRGDRG